MVEQNQRPRFRFRLMTLLFIVSILALLVLVVIQQAQIGRLRQVIDAGEKQKVQLTDIIRELRDHLDRSGTRSDVSQPNRSGAETGTSPRPAASQR